MGGGRRTPATSCGDRGRAASDCSSARRTTPGSGIPWRNTEGRSRRESSHSTGEKKKTPATVQAALDAVDRYIAERAAALFGLVIDYLREAGETRSCTEIEAHFARNFDVSGVTTACEYLADRGLIGKASTPVRLTRRSNVDMQELAFFYVEGRT